MILFNKYKLASMLFFKYEEKTHCRSMNAKMFQILIQMMNNTTFN